MEKETRKFLAGLSLLTGIIALLAWILFSFVFREHYSGIFPYMLAFFFLLNSLFFFGFNRINKKNHTVFIQQFMMLFGVKFIIYLVAAVVIIVLHKKEALDIAISAMILYLLFTGYEVYWLTSLVKRKDHDA